MGVIIVLDYATWQATYPEFSSTSQQQFNTYYAMAQVFVRNDGGGSVGDATLQMALLQMATAHVAKLSAPPGELPTDPSIVGRISNAAEGSVNVASEMDVPPGTAQWWNQTRYGAMVWVAMAPSRTMRYLPGSRRISDPFISSSGFLR